jgi:hypothetical protein
VLESRPTVWDANRGLSEFKKEGKKMGAKKSSASIFLPLFSCLPLFLFTFSSAVPRFGCIFELLIFV